MLLNVNGDYFLLNSINQLVLEMVKCGVLFEARTKLLSIIWTSFSLERLNQLRLLMVKTFCTVNKKCKRRSPIFLKIWNCNHRLQCHFEESYSNVYVRLR
jgi:hypothetical protein